MPDEPASLPGDAPSDAHRINLSWLVRLRWALIAVLVGLVAYAQLQLGFALPLGPVSALLGLQIASNLAAMARLRHVRPIPADLLTGIVAIDVLLFTGLLYFTGGPQNPFSFLYLIQIALAALILPTSRTWLLVALALCCSLGLFFDHHPLVMAAHQHHGHGHGSHAAGGHGDGFDWHLKGMWVAFGVGASFIVYFLARVRSDLAERDRQLERARRGTELNERLASLATLSAGAAHELASPLSTIAVVAKELERLIGDDDATREDVQLIRREVDRCREILNQMSADSGSAAGEAAQSIGLEALLHAALAPLGSERIEMTLPPDAARARVRVARRPVVRALRALARNALDASPDGPVHARGRLEGDSVVVVISDDGAGMSPEVLERAFEPFFTTKEPGQGMGLGLFLARTVIVQYGGTLELDSAPERGTVATVRLPLDDASSERSST